MASVLGAPADEFVSLWYDPGIWTGAIPSYDAHIRQICNQLGVNTEDHAIERAARS
jgi:hypothetical protein